MKEYTIYDHISPSGKHYIGQTCQKPEKRWGTNGTKYLMKHHSGEYWHPHFAKAILKYGWNNFEHIILFNGLSKLEADMIEEDLIYYYKKIGLSYNISNGGEGSPKSEEVKKKISESMKGRTLSEEARQNISKAKMGEKNPNYGKRQSEEIIKKQILKRSIPVIQYSKDGNLIKEWLSATEAGRELSIDSTNICRACKKERKTAGGFVWQYKENL